LHITAVDGSGGAFDIRLTDPPLDDVICIAAPCEGPTEVRGLGQLAFSSDGSAIAVATKPLFVDVYDIHTRARKLRLAPACDFTCDLKFVGNLESGRISALRGTWDVRSGAIIAHDIFRTGANGLRALLSDDGSRFVMQTTDYPNDRPPT